MAQRNIGSSEAKDLFRRLGLKYRPPQDVLGGAVGFTRRNGLGSLIFLRDHEGKLKILGPGATLKTVHDPELLAPTRPEELIATSYHAALGGNGRQDRIQPKP